MSKRPLTVTLVAVLYIAVGAIGFFYHLSELFRHPFDYGALAVELIRLAAILAGVFMFVGQNWARWLALCWISAHVVLSAFHDPVQLAMHAVLLVVIAWVLFRGPAVAYFRA